MYIYPIGALKRCGQVQDCLSLWSGLPRASQRHDSETEFHVQAPTVCLVFHRSRQFRTYLIMAGHDSTKQFHYMVEEKRKELPTSKRRKLTRASHRVPGEAATTDGAPPFMEVYMREAHTIVSVLHPCLALA
jgi:hypothetical protein